MEKSDLRTVISSFLNTVENEAPEVNIMLVDQNNQRKMRYKGLMLRTKFKDIKTALKESLEYLSQEITRCTLDAYDLELSADDSVQTVPRADVLHGEEILQQITVNYEASRIITEATDLSNIKFMVIQIYAGGRSLYLFKKYIQPAAAYQTSQKYTFSGGILKPFTETIITIRPVVEVFLWEDTYYVINRNAFHTIFAYKEVFKQILQQNSQTIEDSGLLTRPDQFLADCQADGRYLPRLTKAVLAKGFEAVAANKQEIPTVVKDYGLSLKFSPQGEIIYEGKESIPEILNLLLRHYVIDALTNHKMIAAAIQQYQAGQERRTKT